MNDLGIRVAFVTSEKLYDHQRDQISRVFGCRVANGYGGRDAGFIAHACPAGGMHITAEDIIVEIVDDAGNPLPMATQVKLSLPTWPLRTFHLSDIVQAMSGYWMTSPVPAAAACLAKGNPRQNHRFHRRPGWTVMHGLALVYILRDLQVFPNSRLSRKISSSPAFCW